MMNNLLEVEFNEIEDILKRAEDTEKFTDERFKITDLNSANWAFRKLAAIEQKRKGIEELADKEIERIRKWQEQEEKGLDGSKGFFEGLLTEYFATQKELDPKFKLSTPYGKVTSRKQQPKWNYEDEKLIGYLENYKPELIRIKKEVSKNDFKKAVKEKDGFILMEDGKVVSNETGELIEGITIEERPDSINIKVTE